MRRLLWRFFPPPEVSATRAHIRAILRQVSPTYPLPGELKRRAIAGTRDAEHVVGLIRDERRHPEQVALALLSSAASGLLMSGRYHVYRGVLSGEGHALTSVFTRCMTELYQRGYQTEAESQHALRLLGEEIKELG